MYLKKLLLSSARHTALFQYMHMDGCGKCNIHGPFSVCFRWNKPPNSLRVSARRSAKSCCTGRKNVEYYSMCLHTHIDSRTGVGVSNSCLYHLCSFGSGRQIKQWHLQHCSLTALIVTLCQKVPYAKPQKLKDLSSILEMRILFVSISGKLASARKCV